jgi:hypothetical protein
LYNESSPIDITKSTHIKARAWDSGTWSALNEATFAVGDVVNNLRITEIMYHPDGDPNAEYIELTNIGSTILKLDLVSFTNGIDFTFGASTLSPDSHVVVVKDTAIFESIHGTGINIAGEFDGRLANGGEKIKLEDAIGQTILDFQYKDGWRDITDGNGFSLTVIHPDTAEPNSYSEKDTWRSSVYVGGSPGSDDSGILPNPGDLVINEVLAHSHGAESDWIELYNTTAASIDLSGWYISDNDSNLTKYKIADGTSIAPYGYKVFYEDPNFGIVATDPGSLVPFALSENGETVYLTSAKDGFGLLTGFREKEDFGASETDVSIGRYEKSTGTFNFVAMEFKTPGVVNSDPNVGPIVISEIMYNPSWPTGGLYDNQQYEYIELYNTTGSAVILYNYIEWASWSFTDAIDYTFPAETPIPAYSYIILAKNPTAFSIRYPTVPSGIIFGPYDGKLSNGGEQLQIGKPGDIDNGTRKFIRVDRVKYDDESPWPIGADGTGMSLHRQILTDYGNDPVNWSAAAASPGL